MGKDRESTQSAADKVSPLPGAQSRGERHSSLALPESVLQAEPAVEQSGSKADVGQRAALQGLKTTWRSLLRECCLQPTPCLAKPSPACSPQRAAPVLQLLTAICLFCLCSMRASWLQGKGRGWWAQGTALKPETLLVCWTLVRLWLNSQRIDKFDVNPGQRQERVLKNDRLSVRPSHAQRRMRAVNLHSLGQPCSGR